MPNRGYTPGRGTTVSLPPAYDGIGRALRAAYPEPPAMLPAEFTSLLDRLG